MKDEFVQMVFAVIAVVCAAAAEELLPTVFGVGFPLLMSLVVLMAPRIRNVLPGVLLAIGAGAFEDALSSLPPMTSVCFFPVVALLSRKVYFQRMFLLLLFPAYGLWAGMCMPESSGDMFLLALAELPMGALSLVVVHVVLTWACGKAGIDG